MQSPVQRAIAEIHARYFEPLTLTALAAEVYVSPFHFSRVFAKATGVTPGRYLTAVRMFEAKRLLLTTSLTVSDIVCSVGYNSVGTFTSRFTQAVGMSPSQFRDPDVGQLLLAVAPHFQRLPSPGALREACRAGASTTGRGAATVSVDVTAPAHASTLLVGLFHDAIPQRGPVAFAGVNDVRATKLRLTDVPPGRWHAIAVAEHRTAEGTRQAYSIASPARPLTVTGRDDQRLQMRLRPLQPTDAPIAITLAADNRAPGALSSARATGRMRHLNLAA